MTNIAALDAEGRSLIWRAADLRARFILLHRAEVLFEQGENRAACTLIHALEYLKDRLAYELYPWPKNCVPADFGTDWRETVELPPGSAATTHAHPTEDTNA